MPAVDFRPSPHADATQETVLQLHGEVDVTNVGELDAAFGEVVSTPGGTVVLDCSRLDFIDASGLEAIARLGSEARRQGRPVVVRDPSTFLQRLLHITGLDGSAGTDRWTHPTDLWSDPTTS